jgi:AcrR family transcriptional regulator
MTTSRPDAPATAAPMGLRERNKLRRADRILTSALELIREDPDQNLTVERIAERAEVAPMTIFNLIGTRDQVWTALADRALVGLDLHAITARDPHQRARRIVDAIVDALSADADVFRVLLSNWHRSARVLAADPTDVFAECLHEAISTGRVDPDTDVRRLAGVMATGLVGAIQQWTAGLHTERSFRTRSRDVVDVAFKAARPS